jgi:hypothetical protein
VNQDLIETRKKWHELFPSLFKQLLEYASTNFPPEKFKELIQGSQAYLVGARKDITETWNKQANNILGIIKNRLQGPLGLEEIEKQGLALIALMENVFLTITKELRILDLIEVELNKVSPK